MLFPVIRNLEDDVLPYIRGNDDIFVAERPGYKVVNYRGFGAFDLADGSYAERVRRECRGLKFDEDGRIMARPFHKFFNYGEHAATEHFLGDRWSQHHLIEPKHDGSMVHVGKSASGLCMMTKMGDTEVGAAATEFVRSTEATLVEALWLLQQRELKTIMFEYVAPTNRIVLRYDRPQLILLAARGTITGEYMDYSDAVELCAKMPSFKSALQGGVVHLRDLKGESLDAAAVHAEARGIENEEGYVLVWPDGFRVKVKSDWYSLLHKKKELMSNPKDVLAILIDQKMDDLVGILDDEDMAKLKELALNFGQFMSRSVIEIRSAVDKYSDKKSLAMSSEMKALAEVHPSLKAAAFRAADTVYSGEKLHDDAIETILLDSLDKLTTRNSKARELESKLGNMSVVGMFE